jgi:selenocysteine-specific elongation factor
MDFFTIATAGHVDHGKTSLLKSITNIDTDTLEQEKLRGLTIDLGFSYLKLNNKVINFIDVPGHENFLKNMLAGISSVNTVLLIISSNEGIMPQTKEHLQIIKLLGIKNIIIVISKVDLINDTEKELLKTNIENYLNTLDLKPLTYLEFSIYSSNSKNNIINFLENFDDLESKSIKIQENNFILPIDRVFIKKGFGTIVTGTIYSGEISIGDYLYIQDKKIKVKNIQVNNENVNKAYHKQRVSLNININEIKRGDILSNKNIKLVNTIDISLNSINKINNNDKIKFYYLTREVNGRINLLNKKLIEHSVKTFAKITLDENIIIEQNMKYIIRLQSPEIILGGGTVVNFHNPQKKINIEKRLILLDFINNYKYKDAFYYLINNIYDIFSIEDILFHLPSKIVIELMNNNSNIINVDKNNYIILDKFLKYKKDVLNYIKSFHENNPNLLGVDKFNISNNLKLKIHLLDKIIEKSLNNELDSYNNLFFVKKDKYTFSTSELNVLKLLSELKFQTFKDLSQNLGFNEFEIKNIIKSLKFKSKVIIISDQIITSTENWEQTLISIKGFIGKNKKTTSEIREYLKLSRKYVIPILEYLDQNKITQRDNDFRVLVAF